MRCHGKFSFMQTNLVKLALMYIHFNIKKNITIFDSILNKFDILNHERENKYFANILFYYLFLVFCTLK